MRARPSPRRARCPRRGRKRGSRAGCADGAPAWVVPPCLRSLGEGLWGKRLGGQPPDRTEASVRMSAHPTEPSTLTATLRANARSPLGKGGKGRSGVVCGRPNDRVERFLTHLGERREGVEN